MTPGTSRYPKSYDQEQSVLFISGYKLHSCLLSLCQLYSMLDRSVWLLFVQAQLIIVAYKIEVKKSTLKKSTATTMKKIS